MRLKNVNISLPTHIFLIFQLFVLSLVAHSYQDQQNMYHLGEDCVRPGFEYFTGTIMGKLRPQLDLKAARYLVPCRAVELGLNATLLDELKIMKVIQRGKISIHSLVQELPQYLAACDGISLSANVTIFWTERATLLPNFYALLCWYCLIQPSSAAAEGVFSLLNNM